MGKIKQIIESMGNIRILVENKTYLNQIVAIYCNKCNHVSILTIAAIYKQYKRGKRSYKCKSCSGKAGWHDDNKNKARNKSKEMWDNPNYAGEIIGKAIAAEAIKSSKIEIPGIDQK
jgi:transposase-like protein